VYRELMKSYLTTSDVAAALTLSEDTVRSYVREGRIPVERTPGGHARYDLEQVQAALNLRPRVQKFSPLQPGEIRLGAGTARMSAQGSFLDDMRFTALEATTGREDSSQLPTWPGVPGSAVMIGRRMAVSA